MREVKRERGEKSARLSRQLIWQKRSRVRIGRLAYGRGRESGGLCLPSGGADDSRQA